MKLRMSFFVTRPPVPVPGTAAGSTLCSAAMRATTGDTNVLPFSAASGATGAAGGAGAASACTNSGADGVTAAAGSGSAGAAAGSDATGAGSGAGGATSAPAGAMIASTVSTSTVSPSCTSICVTTPSAELGTSVSTLSVE